jgi:formate hydrogenlyase subunit 3/multisubunit Na+/H+ antiporter MnhD subunit
MTFPILIACTVVVAAPLMAAAAVQLPRWRDVPRPAAMAGLIAALLAALSIPWMWDADAGVIESGSRLGGGSAIHVDGVTSVMLPFVAVCLLVVIGTAPRRCLDRRATAWFLVGAAATFALFVTAHPALIIVFAVATAVPVWRATRDEPGGRPAARVYAWAMGASLLCLGIGTVMMLADPPWERGCGWIGTAGGWVVATAVLIREGIVPFQFWYPALFSGAPMPVALLATVPQVGSYTAVRLLVGHADGVASELVTLAHLAPITAVYGATLALVQRDLRRLIGYLAFSQSALVLAGLAGALPMELAGGLSLWIASGLSLTGIGIVAAALEGRAGQLRLDLPQGRFWDAPVLAGFFLLFALAGIGLPGTLSFVADDLIVAGSLADHFIGGLLVILATVFAGIAVIRGWFGIFGGPTTIDAPRHGVLPRERIGFTILLALIFGLGIVPGPLVRSLEHAAATLLKHRRDAFSESITNPSGADHP